MVERKKQTATGPVDVLIEGIIKEHGQESAQVLGVGPQVKLRGVISTRCPGVDHAIGVWGLPYGRLSMIYGPEAGGKTTLALQLAAETQCRDGVVLYMDMEHKLDLAYAEKLGVNTKKVILSQPPHLEKCMAVIDTAINLSAKSKSQAPLLIVFDSLNAAPTKAELEGDFEQKHYAPGAGVMSQTLKRIIPLVGKTNTVLLFISQIRQKIGVVFGKDTDTAFGYAPKFYASLIIEVHKKELIKDKSGKVIGNRVEAYIAKNQVAPPFSKVEFSILYGQGTDNAKSILDLGVDAGLIQRAGSWYHLGTKKWMGAAGFEEILQKNPAMMGMIIEQLKNRANQT